MFTISQPRAPFTADGAQHVNDDCYCCLRFLFHLLITPGAIHQVTKEKVREATALPKLEDVIRCRRLRWLGRLSGMDRHRFPRQALTWEPAGFRRRPGRPRRNWKDNLLSRKLSGKWASAWTRLKRLRRTGGDGGIVSPNTSLTRDEPGTPGQGVFLIGV